MNDGPTSNVTTMIDIGLAPEEHYVQFVPPYKFGAIFNSATREVRLVRADGERAPLQAMADKIYTLRGFVGLRRRENLPTALGRGIEDDIIRNILASFESWNELRDAVKNFCSYGESAMVIATWAAEVLPLDMGGQEREVNRCEDCPTDVSIPFSQVRQSGPLPTVQSSPLSEVSEFDENKRNSGYLYTSRGINAAPTSPQEMEEYTLPVPIHTSSLMEDQLAYTTFHPTLPPRVISSSASAEPIEEAQFPQVEFPGDPMSTMDQTSPDLEPEPCYVIPGPSDVPTHHSAVQQFTLPLQFNTSFPINPFFPPMNAAAPSPQKRRRTDPLIDHTELYSRGNTLTRHDIFAEIEALASLEVLTSREITISRKFAMVAKLLPEFGLPWNDTIVARCYSALDVAIKNCVSRMQTYFLLEDSGNCHCRVGPLSNMMDNNWTPRRCDSCDSCIAVFLHHLQLGAIVDVAALLRDAMLRDAMVQFHRNGIQLGLKAAWDDDFRQREFEKIFYSLDLITAHVRFPRKIISSNEEGNWEGRKRRKSS